MTSLARLCGSPSASATSLICASAMLDLGGSELPCCGSETFLCNSANGNGCCAFVWVPSLTGLVPFLLAHPALTCGANEWRRWRDSARPASASPLASLGASAKLGRLWAAFLSRFAAGRGRDPGLHLFVMTTVGGQGLGQGVLP